MDFETNHMEFAGSFGGHAAVRIGLPPFPYAQPLEAALQNAPQPIVTVAMPAVLANLLSANELDAALLPLVDCLTQPLGKVIPGLGVCSAGRAFAERVVIFRNGPALRRVAHDPAFGGLGPLAALVLSVLQEGPVDLMASDPNDALGESFDGALVCGEEPRVWNGQGRDAINLAEAWHAATGRPLVHGFWLCRAGAPLPLLRQILGVALRHAEAGSGIYYQAGSAEMESARLLTQGAAAAGWCSAGARLRLC
jgi:predicted solute-binding protein